MTTTEILDKINTYGTFRILVIGDNEEASVVIASLKRKMRQVEVDFINADDRDTSLSKKQDAVDPINSRISADLLEGYDLILVKLSDSPSLSTIVDMAKAKGVLVSVLGSQAVPGLSSMPSSNGEKYWKKVAARCLFALGFIIVGHVVASWYPVDHLYSAVSAFAQDLDLDATFGLMLLAGFLAQMVDGMLGMGYGVISTTLLLSTGLNPAAISGSIHTAEMFSSGASGFSHYKFGNINKKLFKTLLFPGVIGAISGAILLSYLGEEYGNWLRPALSLYTLLLGLRILVNAFKKKNELRKVKNAGWLAGAGGFLDSFGGGGWGPLVTSTLIAKGKTPRYIIGTVSLTEFFVTMGSALTFFFILGTSHIETIAGLIIGGLLAAPIAARFTGTIKTKTMFVCVGTLVIISSLRTILKAIGGI